MKEEYKCIVCLYHMQSEMNDNNSIKKDWGMYCCNIFKLHETDIIKYVYCKP